MQLEPLTDWLWCLRTPIVQAYAVRERDGFNLIDTTTADNDTAILRALAGIDGRAADDVRVYEVLITHGHDDHTGSAAALPRGRALGSSPPASTRWSSEQHHA
jgi:glyoxylase-like metal-dependent hydrolase (beta-lactamase superfamily II)